MPEALKLARIDQAICIKHYFAVLHLCFIDLESEYTVYVRRVILFYEADYSYWPRG